jgi:hypothetical protein
VCVRECLLELCDGGRGPFNEQKLGERRRRKKNACARPERKTDELELIIIITGAPVCVTLKKWHFISKKESSRKIFIRDRAVRFAVYIQFFPFFFFLFICFLFLKKLLLFVTSSNVEGLHVWICWFPIYRLVSFSLFLLVLSQFFVF